MAKTRRSDLAVKQKAGGTSEVDTSAPQLATQGGAANDDADSGKATGVSERARRRFTQAQASYSQHRALALADTKFAWGDSDNRYQWPADRYEARAQQNKVCLTVNITAQHCNQVINEIRAQRPRMKFAPVDDKGDKRTAEIFTALLRNTNAQLNSDLAHDNAVEHAVYGGEGYWLVATEYADPMSFDQVIEIRPIMSTSLVYIDDAAVLPDRSDARWAFVFEVLSRDEAKARYGNKDGADATSWGAITTGSDWCTADTVRVANYYELQSEGDELWLMPDGSTVLKSQAPDGMRRPERWRPTSVDRWSCHLLVGNQEKPVETTQLPGRYMPIVTVIGKEIRLDSEVIRKGLTRDVKDPQRIVNYAYSETVQSVALQNQVPYLAPRRAIAGNDKEWRDAARTNPLWLPYNHADADGTTIPAPSRQAPPQMNAAQVQLLGMSIEQMKGSSGQHNANFGTKSEAASGIGIQRLKAQGEIATFHFQDNFRRALAYEAKVCLSIWQEILDTRRVLQLIGADDKREEAIADPDLEQSYAEQPMAPPPGAMPGMPMAGALDLDQSPEDAVMRIFNPAVGRFDVVIEPGGNFASMRQEAFTSLMDMAGKNPKLMEIAGDIILDMADFPQAEKLKERLQRLLPPELRGNDQVASLMRQLQQMQQVIQQGGAANEQLQREVERLKVERAGKVVDNEFRARAADADRRIEEFDAETRRLAAVMPAAPALDPMGLQMAVRDALLAVLNDPNLGGGMQPPAEQPPMQPMPLPQGPMGPDGGAPAIGGPMSMQPPAALAGGMPDPGFAPGP